MKLSIYLCLLLLGFYQLSFADSLDVTGYKQIPNDISATRFPRNDANDKLCALIRVISDLDQLGFESNLGIVGSIEKKSGEYWIYVSPGERKLSIWGPNLLRYNFNFPSLPESGKVYQLVVTRKGSSIKDGYTTGFILLKSNPPGAKVWIDGEYRGLTPFQQEMTGGYYSYKLEKAMFYSGEGGFTIKVNETITEEVMMNPNFGSLSVTTSPVSGAQITLDGIPTNHTTPFTFDTLASGKHTMSLLIDLYEPVSREITLKDNEKYSLEIPLTPVFGNIEIASNPAAGIFIDNELKGNGSYSGILTKGMHTIEGRMEKYYTQSRKLDMKAGAKESIKFEMLPITGSLSVVTDPPEAEIFIDGKSYGKSPRIINDLIIGTYSLEFKKENFAEVKITTEIKEKVRTEVKENLSNFKEITITSLPTGANLLLNGKNEGNTPKTLTAPFGENMLKLSKTGYIDLDQSFRVTARQDTYPFSMTSDKKAMAQMDFRKYKWRKNLWLSGTILSAAACGYFYYSAEKHYDEYQTATENATKLHDQIVTEDIVWKAAAGVAGVCGILTIVNGAKQRQARHKMNISMIPVRGGGMMSVCLIP
ncbi:MAG: PEGA domain-containing protein [Bacteroidetes bacterium]|nr:PEGA domain-containing protein [Bacteroidota bacterium]